MKYVHTNIVAKDWKRLARFYQEVFGCVPVPPERDLSGDWLDDLTGLKNSHLRGVHLRLPGYGDDGPTLEIFQYDVMTARPDYAPNTPGFTHLAFLVDDVAQTAEECFRHGATSVGERVIRKYPGGKTLIAWYLADPEGNMLELQTWAEPNDIS
ncbi:VOC family protein [Desulfovibrio inopinatus]|uniref:VOC family protein n=1 Tax=Desulfovibrio inopinatus TaxID=102109 RepID=UPI00040B41F4|nr:VOC family protein [Desulfovibrio inopinatus]